MSSSRMASRSNPPRFGLLRLPSDRLRNADAFRRNAPFDCRFTVGRPGPDADRCSPMPTTAMFAMPRNPDFRTRHELGLRWPHAARKGR